MKKNSYIKLLLPITVTILPVTVLLISLMFNGQKEIVSSENRTATKIESIKNTTYKDKTFQDEFENVLLDQFPFSEELKITKNKVDSSLTDLFRKKVIKQNCEIGRYEIRDGVYNLFCTDYLVSETHEFEYAERRLAETQKSFFGYDFLNAEYYAYLVNDSKTLSDITLKSCDNIYELFDYDFSSLGITTGEFKINSIEDYLNYFYKTDHHWNINGAYRGYKEILSLINKDDSLKIDGSYLLEGNFCGSYCRQIAMYGIDDRFEILNYDYSNLDIYINGVKGDYGHELDYYNHNDLDEYANYYGAIFGLDYGEIKILNKDNKTENLLVISNSMSNPINKMLASNFKEAYIVDLRHYETDLGFKFNLEQYVKEHNIDKVLFLGNIDFFYDLRDQMRYGE